MNANIENVKKIIAETIKALPVTSKAATAIKRFRELLPTKINRRKIDMNKTDKNIDIRTKLR